MGYLTAFDAPLLEDVSSTLNWQLTAGIVFHAREVPLLPNTSGRLLFVYVIVTDKAVREYRAGHNRILEHMGTSGDSKAYIEGVGHFENCINSTKRALRVLNRLSKHRDGPKLDRTARRAAEVWSDEVNEVRNAIEHIDMDIISDAGLPDGSAHLLSISSDGSRLEIGSYHLTLVALAHTLQSMFNAGMAIIQALPTPSATTDA